MHITCRKHEAPMRSLRNLSLTLLSGTALLLAQDPQTGGWRRAGDPPPPAPVERAQPQDPGVLDQDPTQPVARSDGYGQVDQQAQVQQQPQQPQLQQRQAQRPPAAAPRYGLPPAVAIKPGTFITVRLNQVLSSDHNQQGDLFTGTLQQPIVADGIVVAQRGQTVVGRVADAQRSGHGRSSSRLALQLTALTLADGTQANVQSQLVNRRGPSNVGNDVGTVATTTAVGAAIGAAADWGRGAAIGAGAGAAAGIIGVLLTPGRPTIVSPESLLTFRIDSQVIVDLNRASAAFRYVAPDEFERPVQTSMGPPPPSPRGYGAPYPAPYPAPVYYGGYYAPYSPWGSFWGPSFGVGVVVRGGGWGRGWGGYRRWR
uniref:Uncharacterized protein n=1 Tax=Solibacter usitatus (strain Ellin6076) TaxID=234267 RepID=Q029W3_SOLUE